MFPARPDAQSVDVWRVNLDRPRGLLLSEGERERAARFYLERDRVRWSHARTALREVLAAAIDVAPLSLGFVEGPHGKPSLNSGAVEFNLSHSGEWCLIAVSKGCAVGIDIERVRESVEIGKLLRRIGEDAPKASTHDLFQLWARREARTKACGTPLMEIPPPSVYACDIEAPEGYAAAVATVNRRPEVRYQGEV